MQPLVGLIMGSASDWETMRHTARRICSSSTPLPHKSAALR